MSSGLFSQKIIAAKISINKIILSYLTTFNLMAIKKI
tara:strand:+ start:584 stop:694 length:111 start_codon:yes stop_codon:yes gene_type:complete